MSLCVQCGAEFSCAMQDKQDSAPCWCTTMPKLALEQMPANTSGNMASTCLCPACLKSWIAVQAQHST